MGDCSKIWTIAYICVMHIWLLYIQIMMSLQIDILAGFYNLVAHKILNSSFWVSNPCYKVCFPAGCCCVWLIMAWFESPGSDWRSLLEGVCFSARDLCVYVCTVCFISSSRYRVQNNCSQPAAMPEWSCKPAASSWSCCLHPRPLNPKGGELATFQPIVES
jgi:hypothetical protein